MSEKYLDKLAAILFKAENASTPEEADTYFTKAQHLSTAFGIDLEVARRHQADKTKREGPIQKHIVLGPAGQKGLAKFVNLFQVVSEANDVEINIASNSTYVNAFGFPSDIAVVEALYGSLVGQMSSAADAYVRSGKYKSEVRGRWITRKDPDYWGCYDKVFVTKPIDGRVARSNFQDAFTRRISVRLQEARKAAREEASVESVTIDGVTTGKDVVLVQKAVEVSDFFKRTSNHKGTWQGGRSSSWSASARDAGTKAGNSARLGSNAAIGGSRPALVG